MGTVVVSRALPTANSPYPNFLDNPGFEQWQRGTSFSNTSAMTADRWSASYTGSPVFTITRESTIVDSQTYSMKIVLSSSLSTRFRIGQTIDDTTRFSGQTISVSIRAWSNIPGLQIFAFYSGGNINSSSTHPGDSAWHTITMTAVIPNTGFSIWFGWDTTQGGNLPPAAGTFYLDSATMVYGTQPVTFLPLNPVEDLNRCLRYFESYGDGSPPMMGFPYNNAANTAAFADLIVFYKAQKVVNPTLTFSITQIVLNTLPPGANSPATDTPAWTAVNDSASIRVASVQMQRNGSLASTRVGAYQFTLSADTGM
jgi:hypothetical protein